MSHIPGQPKHKLRFYLVILTLLVGGVFSLLMYQKDPSKFSSLTGSSIDFLGGKNATNESLALDALLETEPGALVREEEIIPSREVEVEVSFSSIPETEKAVQFQELEVHFNNGGGFADVKVNTNHVELQHEEVVVKVHNFKGFINFDNEDFSLEGKAKKIEANGLALSSREELQLNLNNVQYASLSAENIEVEGLHLPRGEGELRVAEKLRYQLEQEALSFFVFQGKLNVDLENELPVSLEGVARGIDVSGALLKLDVR